MPNTVWLGIAENLVKLGASMQTAQKARLRIERGNASERVLGAAYLPQAFKLLQNENSKI